MSIFAIIVLAAIPVVGIVGSIAFMVYKHSKGMPTKKAFKMQIATFAAIAVMATIFAFTASAASDNTSAGADDATAPTAVTEQQADAEDTSSSEAIATGMKYLSAALAIGLAGIGGGLALAAGAPAAIAAMSENPKTFGKSIVFLALGEAVALYGLVIAFMILLGIGG